MPIVANADPFGGGGMPIPAANADPFQGMPVQQDPFQGASLQQTTPEVSKLREWEEKHSQDLEDASRKEQAAKQELRTKATDTLQKWYEDRKSEISKKQATNRQDAQTAEKTRIEAMQPGANPWERVVALIDTNARTAVEAQDTSRMRALLI